MTEEVLDTFTFKVLFCVKENYRTGEEIWKTYIQSNPIPFYTVQKKFGIAVKEKQVERALKILAKNGFVETDVTSYTDRYLEKETTIYQISDKGRMRLSRKK